VAYALWNFLLHRPVGATKFMTLSTLWSRNGQSTNLRLSLYFPSPKTVDCIKHKKTLHSVTYYSTVVFYLKFKYMQNTQTEDHTQMFE